MIGHKLQIIVEHSDGKIINLPLQNIAPELQAGVHDANLIVGNFTMYLQPTYSKDTSKDDIVNNLKITSTYTRALRPFFPYYESQGTQVVVRSRYDVKLS